MLYKFLLGLFVLVSFSVPAAAEWSQLDRVSGIRGFLSNLSCDKAAPGVLKCLARYYDGRTYIYRYDGKWRLISKSGARTDAFIDPSCTSYLSPKNSGVFCGWGDTFFPPDGKIVRLVFIGRLGVLASELNAIFVTASTAFSNLSCAAFGLDFEGVCAWRSVSGTLASIDSLKGRIRGNSSQRIQSDPSCAPDGFGSVICAAVGLNGNVIAFKLTYSQASDWSALNIGGTATSPPSCVNFSSAGEVVCTVRGLDLGLYSNRFAGGAWKATNWQGWSNLGGKLKSAPGCANLDEEKIVCAVIGAQDDALYVNVFNGSWRGTRVGEAKGLGQPECSRLTTDKALCTMLGIDGYIYYTVGP